MRIFLVVWFGQVISMLGSGLTSFALGVRIYEQTRSATLFALVTLSILLPGILIAPYAGVLVDRWDRRRALMVNDGGTGLCTALIGLLFWSGHLQLWEIYLLLACGSVFHGLQYPAYSASMAMLVPKEQLGRASGLSQMGPIATLVASPLLAAALYSRVGLSAILLTDLSTFAFALLTLALVRIPRPQGAAAARPAGGSVHAEAGVGWRFIRSHPGLLGLLVLLFAGNFTMGALQVLLGPLVLSFATAKALGTVMAIASAGMFLGSVVMAATGGPRSKVVGILGALVLQGLVLLLGGLQPSLFLVSTAGFLYLFGMPILNGCNQAIWLRKVPHEIQGRVLALYRMATWASIPLANLLAGPLTDYVFEPLLAKNGALAGSVGQILGTGRGRGAGLFFIVLGLSNLAAVVVAAQSSHLRRVEEEVPDVQRPEPREVPAGAVAAS